MSKQTRVKKKTEKMYANEKKKREALEVNYIEIYENISNSFKQNYDVEEVFDSFFKLFNKSLVANTKNIESVLDKDKSKTWKYLIDTDYTQACCILWLKYGCEVVNYLDRTTIKKGLERHHIFEIFFADMSKTLIGDELPQCIYANKLEHAVLHYLIAKERPSTNLGVGGLIIHGMLDSCRGLCNTDDFNYFYDKVMSLPNVIQYTAKTGIIPVKNAF